MIFWGLLVCIALQRIVELLLAKRNEEWIRSQGGYEVGQEHYKWMVTLHLFFFIFLITEVVLLERGLTEWWMLPFSIFLVAQVLRIWCLLSLGSFWNTRIMILPGSKVIKKGPYRFLRHPNYMIVAIEILMIPLIFQAYMTAILFTFLNVYALSIRIPMEEKALQVLTNVTQKSAPEEGKAATQMIPQK